MHNVNPVFKLLSLTHSLISINRSAHVLYVLCACLSMTNNKPRRTTQHTECFLFPHRSNELNFFAIDPSAIVAKESG